MKLSVVTPSLNQARYLGACLDSVRLAAERAPSHEIEHIVIDGGSTDGTTEILGRQTAVRWVSEKDNGQSQAINKGLGLASGDILAYLCADDLYEPSAVQRVLDVFPVSTALMSFTPISFSSKGIPDGNGASRRPNLSRPG